MASIRPLVVISFRVSGRGLIFPFCVYFVYFLVCNMVVPYANRATLPTLALASKPATVKEVIAVLRNNVRMSL